MPQPAPAERPDLDLPTLSAVRLVGSSTRVPAVALQTPANTPTSALSVQNPIESQSVTLLPESLSRPFHDPRHRRHLVWRDENVREDSLSPCVCDTFFAPPVPQPSLAKSHNFVACATLHSHPFLFPIVTPINVDRFETLLAKHPNQPFVKSVCHALRHGFWPWAETTNETYPTTSDHPNRPPQSDHHLDFITKQFREEEACGRFSPSFRQDLLPGMYSVPMHTVPKPRSEKLRMVVDHSAGSPSLNDMINRDTIAGTKMDGMCSFGASLLEFREQHPNVKLIIFKSDVAMAYRRMPMHPLWQLKQIVTDLAGDRHVDHCHNFGGRGSCKIWVAFMSLVIWIAIYEILLAHLKLYVHDSYSFERAGDMKFYPPYNKYYPTKQTDLLLLWDKIGLPHDEPKQLFGDTLEVIGFIVDPNTMSVLFPKEKRNELLNHIRSFAIIGKCWPLREFLRIAGWCNWAFNIFYLLPPGLSALYEKVSGKTNMFTGVSMNRAIVRELTWLVDHLEHLPGIRLFKAQAWKPSDPDVMIVFIDASSSAGLGIFFPHLDLGFQCPSAELPSDTHINFLELLAVASAIHISALMDRVPQRLAVFSDSTFAVDIFNTLWAKHPFNSIVMSSVDTFISSGIDLCVVHIAGDDNSIADALSSFQNDTVHTLMPEISILPFQPPRDALGATPQ